MVICSVLQLTVDPSLYERLPYDPVKDFTPVIVLFSGPSVLLAHPRFPADSVPELIRLAKAQPGKLMYGRRATAFRRISSRSSLSRPRGSISSTCPTRGGGCGRGAAGRRGQRDHGSVGYGNPPRQVGPVKGARDQRGRRIASLPNVPTFNEAGVTGIGVSWVGIVAPAGPPRAIVDRLNREFARALESPDIKAYYDKAGRRSSRICPRRSRR